MLSRENVFTGAVLYRNQVRCTDYGSRYRLGVEAQGEFPGCPLRFDTFYRTLYICRNPSFVGGLIC